MLALPGAYKNFAELEESLTIAELEMILEADREKTRHQQIFTAGLNGIDLIKEENKARMKEIRRRAEAKLLGEQELAEMELSELGFTVETIE